MARQAAPTIIITTANGRIRRAIPRESKAGADSGIAALYTSPRAGRALSPVRETVLTLAVTQQRLIDGPRALPYKPREIVCWPEHPGFEAFSRTTSSLPHSVAEN